ncbi:hypothetical protein [Brevundimonas sp. CEF1]|uniref:hypothetical protein n=1 Tax=Brevundimonas sp. CEF1 TaxID=3442642 RepID=UPI003F510259
MSAPMITGPDGNDRPARLGLTARALAMPLERVAEILTWCDEPDLISVTGEPAPCFDPLDIAAARLAGARDVAEQMASPSWAMGEAAQNSINRAMAQLESVT